MDNAITLWLRAIDATQRSTLAWLQAGMDIGDLCRHQAWSLAAWGRDAVDGGLAPWAPDLVRLYLYDQPQMQARDSAIMATGKLIEAQATMLDAGKEVIDCGHAWLLGCVALSFPQGSASAAAAAEPAQETADAVPARTDRPRRTRRAA